jgi:hypothetical protein
MYNIIEPWSTFRFKKDCFYIGEPVIINEKIKICSKEEDYNDKYIGLFYMYTEKEIYFIRVKKDEYCCGNDIHKVFSVDDVISNRVKFIKTDFKPSLEIWKNNKEE